MAKVLYITANPRREEASFSLTVGRHFLEAYKAVSPADEVVELDLYRLPIPLIDADIVNGWDALQQGAAFPSLIEDARRKIAALGQLTDQFSSADKYIFVTPMWNLGLPPMMKAYLDAVVIPDKTYRYTPQGPIGLLEGRKGIHINARGRVYDGDLARLEFGDSYMKTIMRFVGVQMLDSIVVQGTILEQGGAEELKRLAFGQCEEAVRILATA
ncbi:FMN-dependent NADH-azoreductase [Cohnella sp. REN36]|uniref:FMN-dependent NADH-azoreductase n=1 Tax=Cohnella sp. REN36 TaxID=2887347 RepID=UPI001D152BCB|nr:NAD(P)H-dependent oxidoreductase [Cohnella sp. REN36]MCC3372535.1 NAD(P)H-dependent oxidoreductase [Cohnella sp. REN36]